MHSAAPGNFRIGILLFFAPHHEKDILAEIRGEVLVLVHGGWQIDALVRVLKPLHVRVLVRDDRPSLQLFKSTNLKENLP